MTNYFYNYIKKKNNLFLFELIKLFVVSTFRLLSAMCCNLDSLLLLESQYKLSDVLLQSQKDNVIESSSGQEYVQGSYTHKTSSPF